MTKSRIDFPYGLKGANFSIVFDCSKVTSDKF